MQVKIKRIDTSLPMPEYHTDGAVAFDIYTREASTLSPHDFVTLPTNLIIQIPEGYMLLVAPRSSSAKKKGLNMRNGVGIIDQDFCGPEDELRVMIQNLDGETKYIERGERIAQGIFIPIVKPTFLEVAEVAEKSRGGFGTTG